MKDIRSIFLTLVGLCSMATCMAENPVAQTFYSADPGSLAYKDRFYIYTGRDQASEKGRWFNMREWRVLSSSDMVNWTDHGPKLKPVVFSWSNGDAWASQCVVRNGKFYWYVSASHKTLGGKAIGVAVSDNPLGPFVDPRGSAIITTDMTPKQGDFDDIDPTVFVDVDGQAYLYWGNGKCKYVKLNDDMISTSDSVHYANVPRFGEAPWLHLYNGVYYLSYSSSLPSTIEYCTAPTPTGPWTYKGRILEPVKGCQTSHQAITTFNDRWFLVYHTGTLPGGNNFRRSVCVDEFRYNPDGTIPLVVPTEQGVKQPIGSLNPFTKVEAETMAWSSGISVQEDPQKGVVLSQINNGDFVKIRNVDFGKKGGKLFTASISAATKGSSIQIRLDSLGGKMLGSCLMEPTKNPTDWIAASCKLSKIKGKHDVYLVFKGGEGDLFLFDWWRMDQ